MSQPSPLKGAHTATKIGAILFLVWGVLHVWVGVEGLSQYLTGDIKSLWQMLLGGPKAPQGAFQYPGDAVTILVQRQLILNFVIDVGGYGLLGFMVAWGLWVRASWVAYLTGLFIIGLADLTFLFAMVVSGVIDHNAATLGGPVIWLLAVIITPVGLQASRDAEV